VIFSLPKLQKDPFAEARGLIKDAEVDVWEPWNEIAIQQGRRKAMLCERFAILR
jgi:hypothetical protein